MIGVARFRRWMALVAFAAFVLAVPSRAQAQSVDDFEDRSYSDGTYTLPYRLFVPTDYDPSQSYPIVLFLHGSGERGTDNRLQLTGQTAPLVFVRPENQAQWPSFMIAPQCPPGGGWDHFGSEEPSTWMRLTLEVLDGLQQEFSIDPSRLYITGLSMGGFGTWDAITRYPGYFAGAVPIAGGGDTSVAYRAADTPIWAFHGGADTTVPPQLERAMIAAVMDAGGDPLYTEYPGVGHVGSWNMAYAEPDLLPWLYSN